MDRAHARLVGGAALLILLAVATDGGRARACSLAGHLPHLLDATEQASDRLVPPRPALARVVRVKRGVGLQDGCGGTAAGSSCDDIGTISLALQGTDDRTAPDKLGYRVTVKTGTPPAGLDLPMGDIRTRPTGTPSEPGHIVFAWIDGASNRQEPIDFTLSIAAVDLAGNTSEPLDVRIAHRGD